MRSTVMVTMALAALICGRVAAQDVRPWEQPGAEVGQEIVGPDGGTYVWVPPGEFVMGSPEGEGHSIERPAHRVCITRGFWLGKYEVTVAQFRAFSQATGWESPALSFCGYQGSDYPAAYVDWGDAKAYCEHYGLSLPTEAQWEYAARGPQNLRFPWGNEWDAARCCWAENRGPRGMAFPVGNFPAGASWCGALDMAGNVAEWVADFMNGGYYALAPLEDPTGPDPRVFPYGVAHVARGGSWKRPTPDLFRGAARDFGVPSWLYGFRCALTMQPQNATPPEAGTAPPTAPAGFDPAPGRVTREERPWERAGTEAGQEIAGPDGGVLVWVPGGSFRMGITDADRRYAVAKLGAEAEWFTEEQPARQVQMSGFWLGKHEVTNAQYQAFCRATGRETPEVSMPGDDQPVIWITWADAKAYCDHYGLSLPTEAQWEYGARGSQSLRFPWGNDWDAERLCWSENKAPSGSTFPVGSFPSGASWCGALDMAGNVNEWCADWYQRDYYTWAPLQDPTGPGDGGFAGCHVLRGGDWGANVPALFCSAKRDGGFSVLFSSCIGFRCVRTMQPQTAAQPEAGTAPPTAPDTAAPTPGELTQEEKPWEQAGTEAGEEIEGPDGGVLVWVPAGSFRMGSTEEEVLDAVGSLAVEAKRLMDEQPARTVRLDGFWLGKHEVTVAQYRAFCEAAGLECSEPLSRQRTDTIPVTWVSWEDAKAYCAHYGLRLPTEAQWEYAARGPRNRVFPWGNAWAAKRLRWAEREGGIGAMFPVGSSPTGASWCGALDMAGNVSEWCADWYQRDYYASAPMQDPQGPDRGTARVLRGGSWDHDTPGHFRCASRAYAHPSYRDVVNGFRCVRTVCGSVSPATPSDPRNSSPRDARPPGTLQ